MKHQTIDKNCEYCGKPFQANRSTAKYCGSTCKTYASQERTGRRDPAQVSGLETPTSPTAIKNREAQILKVQNALDQMAKRKDAVSATIGEKGQQVKKLYQEKRSGDHSPPELEQIDGQIQSIKAEIKKLELQFDRLLFAEMRLKRERFDLFLPNAIQREQFKGKDLRMFAEYRVKYPFNDLKTDTNLHAFGNAPQPFICYMCEGNTTGEQDSLYLVEVLAGIAAELLKFIQTEILFIIDRQMMNRHFEEAILKNNLDTEQVTLKFAGTRAEIETVLQKEHFEFVFFPDLSVFNLDYDFLMGLLKNHPRTSIFCASEKPLKDFLARNRINIQIESGWNYNGAPGILVTGHSEYVFAP